MSSAGDTADTSKASTISVPIGGFATASCEGSLRTFLGSCVGLAVYDRRLKIAGLAHVVLPTAPAESTLPGKYADSAVPALIAALTSLAAGRRLQLTARLVGGAKMFAFQTGPTVGEQNVQALEKALDLAGIPVVSRDCGGGKGRRMTLEAANGQITIETLGAAPKYL